MLLKKYKRHASAIGFKTLILVASARKDKNHCSEG
jgi:hypothetical protein